MKIYTRVVIDMVTLEEVKVECLDYHGPVAECKGGGGGGAGAGVIDYPDYMETMHTTWLDDVDGYMDDVIGSSPYTSATPYDPDDDLTEMDNAVAAFNNVIDAIIVTTDYATYSSAVRDQVDGEIITTTRVDGAIAAYADVLNDEYDSDVAKLKASMLDIGASMSSAILIAEADLHAKKERTLTDFGGKLYVETERQRNEMINTGVQLLLNTALQRVRFEGDVARLTADTKRIRIVAKGEETREGYEYDELDARWDLEMTKYGAAMMASIGGGVVGADSGKMSKTQSVLSGALSGAASGAMVGSMVPGIGTGVGLGVGAALGAFGGLLQ